MANINYDGTNIVGASFKDYVNEQIQVRQEKLGKLKKSSEEIVWQNGKSAFISLASSVNIKNNQILKDSSTGNNSTIESDEAGNNRIKLMGLSENELELGNFLARNVVLHGGTSYYNPSEKQELLGPNYRFGLKTNNDDIFGKSNYGFGGGSEGLKPMPGITSFNLKSRNMGSLREASVTIRANSQEQFKMIDNLYCRIGYTMFLEWGNSIYFDNEGKYQSYKDGAISLISTFLKGEKKEGDEIVNYLKAPTRFIQLIEDYREKSNGNYDAFFGRVKNFSWEFKPEGQYWEITLSLISWGDIIESLTIDGQYEIPDPSLVNDNLEKNSALTTFLAIAAEPDSETITYRNNKGVGGFGDFPSDYKSTTYKIYKNRLQAETLTQRESLGKLRVESEQSGSDTIPSLNYERLETSLDKVISGHALFGSNHYFYVRFGDILDFIRDRLLLYNSTGENEAIVDIDTDTDKNIMYCPGVNISADPSKVMVRQILPFKESKLKSFKDQEPEWEYPIKNRHLFKGLEFWKSTKDPNDRTKSFPLHGKIMNIYFEYQYLIDTIKQLRNEETGKIPLFDFLKNLLNTANSCLGGVNKLSVRLESDRIIKIYDQNAIPGTQTSTGTILNSYGIIPSGHNDNIVSNQGSFVKDISVRSELTNDFSTTISVGAQAQGSVVGEDSTGLSKWNFGLVDRYYPEKIDSLRKNNKEEKLTDKERFEKLTNKLKFLWLGYSEGTINSQSLSSNTSFFLGQEIVLLENIYNFKHFPINRISDFVKSQKDWLQLLIKLENKAQNDKNLVKGEETFGTNQIGMIPINIQTTMDGLSGIRIYDKLTLDTRFLPSYYPQTLYWIIKGVSHEIQNNKWYTKLETIAVPKLAESQQLQDYIDGKLEDNENSTDNENSSTTENSTDNENSSPPEQTPPTVPPSPEGKVNVTNNIIDPVRNKIITRYGWPIIVEKINNQWYAEVSSTDTSGRNLYIRNEEYVRKNARDFLYKGQEGTEIKVRNVNKDLFTPLKTVLERLDKKNLLKNTKVDAVIYPRDTTNTPGKLSGHSFGVALDVNSNKYPYGNKSYEQFLKDLESNVPEALVIQEFRDSDLFFWGGDYKSSTKDPHHFSLKTIGNI